MLINVENAGQHGIIRDIPPHELPLNAWSGGQNVRANENAIHKFLGYEERYASCPIVPYYATPVSTPSNYFWAVAGLNKVYVSDGSTWYNITRQSAGVDDNYAATADTNWTGGVLGGILILNNGVDEPQAWTTASTGTRLSNLANWPSSTTAKVIRPFRQFLVALDVTKSGTQYSKLVKWSHSASFSSVPSSWDETDATKDAGEYELAETGGDVIDGAPLRDQFFIYKDDAIVAMQFIGPPYIFGFKTISPTVGALTRRCIKEFSGGHFVLGSDDVILMDGQKPTSLLNKRMRRWLYNSIDNSAYVRSFVVPNYQRSEMWACFPQTGSSYPDTALVWNYRDNTLSVRDLPDTSHIAYGVVNPGGATTWASQTNTWTQSTTYWNQKNYNPTVRSLLMVDPGNTKLYQADETNQEDGSDQTSYIERTGISISQNGERDLGSVKFIRAIYPKVESTGSVNVYVGHHMSTEEGVAWEGPYAFNPDTDYKIDCRVTGRFIGIKVESTEDVEWKLNGYSMDVDVVGNR